MKYFLLWMLAALVVFNAGCEQAYYGTMEKFGVHKRDILVERVEESKDAQQQAKEQFSSALERFSEVLGFQGGELEEKYDALKEQYDKSKARAERVSSRIRQVEDVAEDLFDEWSDEIELYTNEDMKRTSKQTLERTRDNYEQLIRAMKKAESKMLPVLDAFRDQVLFLKHNLNAQAVASLKSELVSIEADIAVLIKEMEASIAEADEFIKQMK